MKEIELSKNQEDRIVNRVTGRGCPKCGYIGISSDPTANFYNKPSIGHICGKCDYQWSTPNPNYKQAKISCGSGLHSTVEEVTHCGNYDYKCVKCGAEWCDHTNIETWEQEFYRLLTHKGETGVVFNNPQWNAHPEKIIRILKKYNTFTPSPPKH